jgi:signal transduction histidine kinase
MNDKRYRWILYTIVTVIIVTIGIQIYWNYKNYQTNKQQLINDVLVSLDKAVDDYYADLAEKTTIGFSLSGDQQNDPFEEGSEMSNILKSIDTERHVFTRLDCLKTNQIEGIKVLRGRAIDSMNASDREKKPPISIDSFKAKMKAMKVENDSVDLSSIKMLTSKIVVSIKNDTLDLNKVYNLIREELDRKNINVDYDLVYYDIKKEMRSISNDTIKTGKPYLTTVSKSTFLPKHSTLSIAFIDDTKVILKRILGGILISTLLVLAVISCLFYLLKIIKDQKQLAEVKNDLISNITHEFKTPIATISVALESIRNFNVLDDIEKTKKYLNMSSEQLGKLNIMVEKLLETATLDSDNLELQKEPIDIIEVSDAITNRYKIQFPDKEFHTSFKIESLICNADVFHIENAINNILDNAVKYGGPIISIVLIPKDKSLDILISDNGNTLTKTNTDRIFEKFYRVPKGNTHDVKGFGIGLYYTKTIIEKHKGSVNVELSKNLTTFKITLPNG